MDVAEAQFLDNVEELKLLSTIETLEKHRVLSGITKLIVKQVLEWKRRYKGQERIYAAKGLIGIGNYRPNTN